MPVSAFEDEDPKSAASVSRANLDDLRKRQKVILDEYLSSLEMEEATSCLKSLLEGFPSLGDELVASMVRHALDTSKENQKRIWDVLNELQKHKVVGATQFVRGYVKLVCTWEDLVLDNPRAPAELVAMMLDSIQAGWLDKGFLSKLPEALLVAAKMQSDEPDPSLSEVLTGLQQFKSEVKALKIQESWSARKAGKSLGKLGRPECNFEFVRQAVVISFDGDEAERGRCVSLLKMLRDEGVLLEDDLRWGLIRLFGQLDDLVLDCPNSSGLSCEVTRMMLEEKLLSWGFIWRCRLLRIGGSTGVCVLDSVWERAPEEIKGVYQGALAKSESAPPASDKRDAPIAEASKSENGSPQKSSPLRPGGSALRPGGGGGLTGGLSLRPGGLGGAPGGSLSGLTGSGLRPGGAGGGSLSGTSSLTGEARATDSSESPQKKGPAGYPASKEDGDNWRDEAANQQAKQLSRRQRDRERNAAKREANENGDAGERKEGASKSKKDKAEKEPRDREPMPKLTASESSFGAAAQRRRAQAGDESEQIVRKLKSILNKLTEEKFDSLMEQLVNCGISTESHLEVLITEVFEKATTQHHFVEMYCRLCARMSEWSERTKIGNLKRILLNQCQASFEANLHPPQDLKDAEKAGGDEEEILEKHLRYKMRMLGNVKLVGRLLVERMVASKVLIACAEELALVASEATLEALALLLTTAGKEFDKSDWNHHAALRGVFSKIEKLSKEKKLAPRSRFLLQDLLDLRNSGWVDNKVATKKLEGPKKLKEVAEGPPAPVDDEWSVAQKKK